MNNTYVCVIGVCLMLVVGCRHVEPSPIVTAFRNAGGGDPDHATPESISAFLAKREYLRKQLTPLCKQKSTNAPADWATTDEGKVCTGNTSANFAGKVTFKSDGVAF